MRASQMSHSQRSQTVKVVDNFFDEEDIEKIESLLESHAGINYHLMPSSVRGDGIPFFVHVIVKYNRDDNSCRLIPSPMHFALDAFSKKISDILVS